MLRKHIVLFTCEPGGAEVLTPVVELLKKQEKYKITTLAYGLAVERFRQNGVDIECVSPIKLGDQELFEKYSPDLIITSATSLPTKDMSEKYIWENSRSNSVKTVAFVDQWQNYSLRFSGPTVGEHHKYMPDLINCINQTGYDEMVAEGFPSDRLLKLGQPYLSTIKEKYGLINKRAIEEKLGIGETINVVLFVSEAIYENYGRVRGYDQYDALEVFLAAIALSEEKCLALIKLHPKDDPARFKDLLKRHPQSNVKLVQNEFTSLDCICVADIVCGMSSVMLVEAFILGVQVVSIQPNLLGNDPFVLSRAEIVARVSDVTELHDILGCRDANRAKSVAFEYTFSSQYFLDCVCEILG